MSQQPARRIRMRLCYDGGAYRGFQLQPGGGTIQAVVEEALSGILQETVRVRAAGRTDAGVHAREQVVDFADSGRRDPAVLVRGGNALLPPDIRILSAEPVPLSFDARRDAGEKEYRYHLHLAPVDSPFLSRYAWRIGEELDLPAMEAALRAVVGRHDFSSFRGQGCTARTPVRTVLRAEVAGEEAPEVARPGSAPGGGTPGATASLVRVTLAGEGFLRHMVRNLVGTLVEVGRRRIPAAAMGEILRARDRTRAGPTAPACGLFLWRIRYDTVRADAGGGDPPGEGGPR